MVTSQFDFVRHCNNETLNLNFIMDTGNDFFSDHAWNMGKMVNQVNPEM